MAFYISIVKLREDHNMVFYRFTSKDDCAGIFSIDKRSGEVVLVESMPGDERGHFFNRAATKVLRAWKDGGLPDSTEWAS